MEASRLIGRSFLLFARGLLVSSAHEPNERSDRFSVADVAFDIFRLVFSRVPVSDYDLRPREGRPDPTQQELELRRVYGTDRDEDHGIRWGVWLSLGGRANSGQATERRAAGSNAEIEADGFGNQLGRRQIQASPPGDDKHRPGNRPRLCCNRRRLLLAPVFEGLLHELQVFSDSLAEFAELFTTQDASFLIVRCHTESRDHDLVEIVLECMLADPLLGLLGGQVRFFRQELMVKVLMRLKDRLVPKQYAQKLQTG